ncbi:30S ribosomal protein S11 [Candidatus Berkelbacteria bacterium RIFCSPHIGHO2_12_FULL_36_9]|uniref:Small ribosomal subunit protein uS11 n=1 Tax=Candidatus Berkelbacteria bacterium RIFCSPHIGHO2_12_FULL_36_9 TaxID=1797469 RepID=A0A1F5EKU7_9BACT|nr:MAG: 30S ribosomal protein S11 [Candidatus Berkelbacteria bacterium RIFCSPHIGHO2_12_FULL_36_9]
MVESTKSRRKKIIRREVAKGRIYIQSTFNNTIVSVTDDKGNSISWASSGSCGFKGTRKSTPYAAQIAAQTAINKAKVYNLKSVDVYVSGVGSGRESAVRALNGTGIMVTSIKDVTPVPHNGTRPKKPRRV